MMNKANMGDIVPASEPACDVAGPASWQCIGRSLQEMSFDVTVDWADAWRLDVEPALRGTPTPEDDPDPDTRHRSIWSVRNMRRSDAAALDRRAIVEMTDTDLEGEIYKWSPGFFDLLTDATPGHQPPDSIRVCLREQLLGLPGGAKAALSFVEAYLEDFGIQVTASKPVGMEFAADFLIDGAIGSGFLRAHAPPERKLRQYDLHWSRQCFMLDHWDPAFAIGMQIFNKMPSARLATGGTIRRRVRAEQVDHVWCVRSWVDEPVLRHLGIDTAEAALGDAAHVWRWATSDWFSLRTPGPRPWDQRPLSPWWQAVHAAWGS